MVTVEQIKCGVANYFEKEFCSKATGVGKFGAYFILPSVTKIVDDYIRRYKEMPFLSDLFDGDKLNLDLAESRAKEAMRKCGSVEFMGFKLNEDDVGALSDCIRRA